MRTLWRIVRTQVQPRDAVICRSCRTPIHAGDDFGVSERVCAPCRDDDGAGLNLPA